MTTRTIGAAVIASLWFSACAGEEYVVEVRLEDSPLGGLGCEGNRRGMQSVHIQVLRWRGWDDQVEIDQECISLDDDAIVGTIENAEDLIAWFDGRGYIVRAIPTDARTIVRVRGYPGLRCPTEDIEPLFCAMPALQGEGRSIEPIVLTEELTTNARPIPLTVICHPELVPGPPLVCSNSLSSRCSDNVCGFNEGSVDCEQDCGALPDLCRWYRACAYFRQPF